LVGASNSENQNRIIAADTSFQMEIGQEVSRLHTSAMSSLSSADVMRKTRDVNASILKRLRLELTTA